MLRKIWFSCPNLIFTSKYIHMYKKPVSTIQKLTLKSPQIFEWRNIEVPTTYSFIGPRVCFIGNREGCGFAKKRQPPSIRPFFQNKPLGVSHMILPNFQFPVIFDGVLDCFILILLVIFNDSKFVLGPWKFYCKKSFLKSWNINKDEK